MLLSVSFTCNIDTFFVTIQIRQLFSESSGTIIEYSKMLQRQFQSEFWSTSESNIQPSKIVDEYRKRVTTIAHRLLPVRDSFPSNGKFNKFRSNTFLRSLLLPRSHSRPFPSIYIYDTLVIFQATAIFRTLRFIAVPCFSVKLIFPYEREKRNIQRCRFSHGTTEIRTDRNGRERTEKESVGRNWR